MLLRGGLGISQSVVNNCIVHHLSFLASVSLSLFVISLFIKNYFILLLLILFLLQNYFYLNPWVLSFFFDSLSHATGRAVVCEGVRVSGCMPLSWYLVLGIPHGRQGSGKVQFHMQINTFSTPSRCAVRLRMEDTDLTS